MPGDTRPAYEHGGQGRQILNDCEDDLKDWQPEPDAFSTPGQSPERGLRGNNEEVTGVEETDSIQGNLGPHGEIISEKAANTGLAT